MFILEGVKFLVSSSVTLHYGQLPCDFKLESFILEKKLDFPQVVPLSTFHVAACSSMQFIMLLLLFINVIYIILDSLKKYSL